MPKPKKPPAPSGGLRERKKLSTRRAIERAAMSLFSEQGYEATTLEQVAERAEVSPATFFRYFRNKADLVVSDHASRLPLIREAFLKRPASESDFEAARIIFTTYGDAIEMMSMENMARAFWASPNLDEARFRILRQWVGGLAETLAERRGLPAPNGECFLMARFIFGVVGSALDEWMQTACREEFPVLAARNFDTLARLGGEWAKANAAREVEIVKAPAKKRKTG